VPLQGRKCLTKRREDQEGFTKKDSLLSRRMTGPGDGTKAL
jgi:hypothetical protein